MKRAKLGAVCLVLLLGVSLGVSICMERIHAPVARDLELAAQMVCEGDFETALSLEARADAAWQRWDRFRACFCDHTPMEEADALFRKLRVYAALKKEEEFAAACAELARKVSAVGEAHALRWWNFV